MVKFVNRLATLLAMVTLASATSSVDAVTTYTWNGATGDLVTNTNWSPNGVPTTGDTVQFGTTGVSPVFQNQDFATRNITYLSGANSYPWTANGVSNLTVG